jgi:hypothetical protein
MPGMRVLDAHVHIGCHHLPPMKVHYQLTLAGIEGATFLADPEKSGLRGAQFYTVEVTDRWRRPRYLSRRGNFHSQRPSHPSSSSVPATPPQYRCIRQNRRFPACDDLSPQPDFSLMADGNEQLTQGLRKRKCLYSHREESLGFAYVSSRACFRSRRLCVTHPGSYRRGRGRDFGSRRVVPAGRLAIRGGVRHVYLTQRSPRICWRSSPGGQCANCYNRAR